MKRVAINASAWHLCVCKLCVDLGFLILGHSICALITSNTSVRFDFELADKVHEYLQNTLLYVVKVKLRVQQMLPDLLER